MIHRGVLGISGRVVRHAGRGRGSRHRMSAVHRTGMQQPRIADDDGEPEREERGKRASPASAAGHGYSKYSSAFLTRGQRAPPSTLSGASRFQANLSCTRRVECTKGPEAPMIRPKSLRQLAAYSISLPAFAVSPKMAKETVYMPSQV